MIKIKDSKIGDFYIEIEELINRTPDESDLDIAKKVIADYPQLDLETVLGHVKNVRYNKKESVSSVNEAVDKDTTEFALAIFECCEDNHFYKKYTLQQLEDMIHKATTEAMARLKYYFYYK